MKAKFVIATVIGLVACNAVLAQTDSPDSKAQPATPATQAAEPVVQIAAAEPQAAAPETKAAASETTKVAAAEPPPASAPTAPGAIIPLIQFQGVPLTTAIENLARQANLNYILDPKVGYGQPDDKGGPVKVEPNISVRWENLTAEQALTGLLSTYGLEIVDDSKTKIARVTLKNPAALEPMLTKVVQLKFASPSNILTSVQTVLSDKRSRVVPDTRTSQLVVSATEKELEAVDTLVTHLDTQTKQVLIEAKILETTLNPKTSKGVDWSGTLKNQNFTLGNNALAGVPPSSTPIFDPNIVPATQIGVQNDPGSIGGILNDPKVLWSAAKGFQPATAFLNADGFSAALSFLNQSGDTKVVSEPRIVTLDNQKASIDVGLMFPIVNVSAGTANTSGGSAISYSNLTVNLDVTPRIAANNFIELKVQQGVLRLGPDFTSTVGGVANKVNSFFSRKLDTSVLIPSGNTLVMGGLIQDEKLNGNTKVPLLGDIPVLGLLFRKDSKELNRQNLTIFITPTVVVDGDFQPAHTDYLKTTGKEEVKENWNAWDSGKPAFGRANDWSRLESDK